MYKNWTAICAEENPVLRLLAATVEDERILAGLQKGFPELFAEEVQREPRVPLSAIRALVLHGGSVVSGDDAVEAYDACHRFNIPLFYFGPGTARHDDPHFEPVPDQFDRHRCTRCIECAPPYEAEWRGEKMVIVYDHEDGHFLVIAPSRCIDFDK